MMQLDSSPGDHEEGESVSLLRWITRLTKTRYPASVGTREQTRDWSVHTQCIEEIRRSRF
jgi:hypothetical protein